MPTIKTTLEGGSGNKYDPEVEKILTELTNFVSKKNEAALLACFDGDATKVAEIRSDMQTQPLETAIALLAAQVKQKGAGDKTFLMDMHEKIALVNKEMKKKPEEKTAEKKFDTAGERKVLERQLKISKLMLFPEYADKGAELDTKNEDELKKLLTTAEQSKAQQELTKKQNEEKAIRHKDYLLYSFLALNGVDEATAKKLGFKGRQEEALKKGWKSEADAEKLIGKAVREKKETAKDTKRRNVHAAVEFLYSKKISTAGLNDDEMIAEAVKASGGKKIEDIGVEIETARKEEDARREKLRAMRPTARELERILTPEKAAQLNKILDDKEVPLATHKDQDLDSKIAIYILQNFGGAQDKKVLEIAKGTTRDNAILVDVGDSDTLLTVGEKKAEFNHHSDDAWIKTSTSEIVLDSLIKIGRAEEQEWIRNLTNFVTEVDNMSYPRKDKEWFENTYSKTILGLHKVLPVEMLIEYFKKGKDPYEPFTDEELANPTTFKNSRKETITLVDACLESQGLVKQSIEGAEWHEWRNRAINGNKTYTTELGKILFYEPYRETKTGKKKKDEYHGIPLGAHAAYNLGYDSYVRWDPEQKGYFISLPGGHLEPIFDRIKHEDPDAKIIRSSMIQNFPDAEQGRAGTKLAPGQFLDYVGLLIKDKEKTKKEIQNKLARIIKTQNFKSEKKGTPYTKKLEKTELFFRNLSNQATENRILIEEEMNKPGNAKLINPKMLLGKIETLKEEEKFWQGRVQAIQALKGQPETLFNTLVNWKETDVEEGTEITEEETVVTPPEETEQTPEEVERAAALEREKEIEKVFQEYEANTAELEAFNGTKSEGRTLIARHYYLHELGTWLENGGVGERPTEKTYAELIPKIYAKELEEFANTVAKGPTAPTTTPTGPEITPTTPGAPGELEARIAESKKKPAEIDQDLVNEILGDISPELRGDLEFGLKHVATEYEYKNWWSNARKVKESGLSIENANLIEDYLTVYKDSLLPETVTEIRKNPQDTLKQAAYELQRAKDVYAGKITDEAYLASYSINNKGEAVGLAPGTIDLLSEDSIKKAVEDHSKDWIALVEKRKLI